ncbi:MAG: DUF349 domain-containing protein [Bacteroidales bacterium]|nr:DUF349 domain-containing protein [Bacteroidales bacterium]
MTDALEQKESLDTEFTANNDLTNETLEKKQESKKKSFSNREEIISELKELLPKQIQEVKDDVDFLKQQYYKLRKHEVEIAKNAFIEQGNTAEDFSPEVDALEETLKSLLNEFRTKKLALMEEVEKVKEENLAKKEAVLEKLEQIVADPDTINKNYNEFIDLQHEFKEINDIPEKNVNPLWKRFQKSSENFYDLLKINKELRDYDFKKNLDKKESICAEAEALLENKDIIASFRALQTLHDEWRRTGPVAQNLREEIWTRFKDASTQINKRHQDYFEQLKKNESEVEEAKTALCVVVESIDIDSLKTSSAWDEKTKEIIECQEKWKTLGFASKKVNNALFERFRKACDTFFTSKSEFFKAFRNEMQENIDKKKALCQRALELKDSTNWRQTTDLLVNLQKEWKTVGQVPRKIGDQLWKQFIEACDFFFEQKEKALSAEKGTEKANLEAKKQVVAKLQALFDQDKDSIDIAKVKELTAEWNNIGHVPFKEKDIIYGEYQAIVNKLFKHANQKGRKVSIENFTSNVAKMSESDKGQNSLLREREKLMRNFENIKNELKTYENNMGFLSVSSKGANSLLKEMERKVESLKEDMKLIAQKIDLIDSNLK